MVMNVGLEGSHAMITGTFPRMTHCEEEAHISGFDIGGSRGLGRAIVETFVKEGINVSYCARNVKEDDFAELHNILEPSNNARAFGTSVDISSRENIAKWVEQAGTQFGRIDILIANGSLSLAQSHLEPQLDC